jgi:hypothetical protein
MTRFGPSSSPWSNPMKLASVAPHGRGGHLAVVSHLLSLSSDGNGPAKGPSVRWLMSPAVESSVTESHRRIGRGLMVPALTSWMRTATQTRHPRSPCDALALPRPLFQPGGP